MGWIDSIYRRTPPSPRQDRPIHDQQFGTVQHIPEDHAQVWNRVRDRIMFQQNGIHSGSEYSFGTATAAGEVINSNTVRRI